MARTGVDTSQSSLPTCDLGRVFTTAPKPSALQTLASVAVPGRIFGGEFVAPLVAGLGPVVLFPPVATLPAPRVRHVLLASLGGQMSRVGAPTVEAGCSAGARHVLVMARVIDLETFRDLPVFQFVGHSVSSTETTFAAFRPELGIALLTDPARPAEALPRTVFSPIVVHLLLNREATRIDPRLVLVPKTPTTVIAGTAETQCLVDHRAPASANTRSTVHEENCTMPL